MNSCSKVKSSLTCSYCSKILKNPIELPCDDLICEEHLKEKTVVRKNKIKCLTCKQEFQVKGNEFKLVKSIQKQINSQIFLNEEEISLKKKIEDSIKQFYQMYDEFSLSKNKVDLDCHNHFQEIRFQLDMHREKLKEKIDEIYMEMIEKTKEFEMSYLNCLDEKLSSSLKSIEIKSIVEDLNATEETFRDPNLLIESIREMNLKQKNAIDSIQLNLNEMSQVNEDLKASNQFKPFLSFNQDLFGQLHFNLFPSGPFKSKILSGQQPWDLIKLCEFDSKYKFKLLYRASEHGFHSSHFHLKCDGHANTLTILKASCTSFIFGGFTSATWDSSSQHKPDPNAFLFSLTNKDYKLCKIKIQPGQNAIYCPSSFGPTFGGGSDIYITSNSNTTNRSYSNLGTSYRHPQYAQGTNEAQSFLAGSYNFLLSEIEVYQKE